MSHRVSVVLYLHHNESLDSVLAPAAAIIKDAKHVQQQAGTAHFVYHGHLEDDDLRDLQTWIRSLPAQTTSGHVELDCNSDEPTKLMWSDVFVHRESGKEAFREGLTVFLSEAQHFLHM